jgi:hypothetical protein
LTLVEHLLRMFAREARITMLALLVLSLFTVVSPATEAVDRTIVKHILHFPVVRTMRV